MALRGPALWRVIACMVLGAVAGYLLVPSPGTTRSSAGAEGAAPAVLLEGRPLPVDGEPALAQAAARAVARAWLAQKVTLTTPGAPPREITRELLGVRVETERLAALVAQVRDPRSPLRRGHARAQAPLRVPLPASIDGPRALAALVALKDDLDRRPVDARLDVGAHTVLPDEPGRRVDAYATLARLDVALRDRPAGDAMPAQLEAAVEAVPAARTAAQIGEIQVDEILGWFETKYARDLKHYPSTTQIWRVGTGEPDPKFEPKDDEHPEYVADDYLAISQGPHIIVPKTGLPSTEGGGAMVESRVAGRYGTHGWTEREGFGKPRPHRARQGATSVPTDDDARPD